MHGFVFRENHKLLLQINLRYSVSFCCDILCSLNDRNRLIQCIWKELKPHALCDEIV